MFVAFGEEIPKDVEAAVKWLSLSAGKRKSICAVSAWNAISQGEVFSPQVEVAMKWLQQAAEQKNEWAFYQLGKLYLSGEHVTKKCGNSSTLPGIMCGKKETSMLSMCWESYISVAEMFPVIGKRQWNI